MCARQAEGGDAKPFECGRCLWTTSQTEQRFLGGSSLFMYQHRVVLHLDDLGHSTTRRAWEDSGLAFPYRAAAPQPMREDDPVRVLDIGVSTVTSMSISGLAGGSVLLEDVQQQT